MDDDVNLSQQGDSNAIIKGNDDESLTCDLHIEGGEVHLPRKNTIVCDSRNKGYVDIISQNVPLDLIPEVVVVVRPKGRSFSPLQIILIILFITAIAICSILIIVPPNEDDGGDPDISSNNLFCSSEYKKKYSKADKLYNSKKYSEVIDLLEKDVLEISENPTKIKENNLLLRTYFNAVKHAADCNYEKPKGIIKKIIKADPDRLGWRLDDLWLHFPECRTNDFTSIAIEDRTPRYYLIEYEYKEYKKQNYDSDDWRKKKVDSKENKIILDLYLARRYFCHWLYDNPKENLELKNSGLEKREMAYALVKEYTKVNDVHLCFVDLGIKILDEVYAAIGLLSRYYFDGKKCWGTTDVENARNYLKALYIFYTKK